MSKLVVHLPHSSTYIPDDIRKSIRLTNTELDNEIHIMTDLYTDRIFKFEADTIKFNCSRLVCDVERFEDDSEEEMSTIGMGAVYTKTSTGKILRDTDERLREYIIDKYYKKHHRDLERAVESKLKQYNECMILDCHSFNENVEHLNIVNSADICIGTDSFHTPIELVKELEEYLRDVGGYTVAINNPYKGSIVPLKYYNNDKRVSTIMIEVNRRVYMSGIHKVNEEGMGRIKSILSEFIGSGFE